MVHCPVCLLKYSTNKRPKQLSCDHTLCNCCLLQLDSKKCPVCRHEILSTTNNFVLEEYLQESKIKRAKYNILNDSEDDVEDDEINNENEELKIVNKNGLELESIRKQTVRVCLAAVIQNGMALKYVKEQHQKYV